MDINEHQKKVVDMVRNSIPAQEYNNKKHWTLQTEKLCDYINTVLFPKTGIKVKPVMVKKTLFIQITKGQKQIGNSLVDPLHEGYGEKRMHDFALGVKYALQIMVDDV